MTKYQLFEKVALDLHKITLDRLEDEFILYLKENYPQTWRKILASRRYQ